jgi:hypothetical protein
MNDKHRVLSANRAEEKKADTTDYRISSSQHSRRNAGDFFVHFKRLHDVTKVILYGRDSTPQQVKRGNVDDQIAGLRAYVSHFEVEVVGTFTDDTKGWRIKSRPGLLKAFALARKTGAVILAESTSRFVRAKGWDPKDKKTWSLRPDYRRFARIAGGVLCATKLHPNASRPKERSK